MVNTEAVYNHAFFHEPLGREIVLIKNLGDYYDKESTIYFPARLANTFKPNIIFQMTKCGVSVHLCAHKVRLK